MCPRIADGVLGGAVWASNSAVTAVGASAGFTMDVDLAVIGATVSCLMGSAGSAGVGGGDSVITAAPVRSEIEGVICCVIGWGDENVCIGTVCCTGGEGAEAGGGMDRDGAWLGDDAVG